MSANGIARVHYYPRQFLRTEDFLDEQDYHLGMQHRHNIAQHSWGIVRGLELSKDKDGNLAILSGAAVDGYGRYVILEVNQPLDTRKFDEKQCGVLDVWLVYNEQSGNEAPPGYAGCGDSQADNFYRWQENPIVRLDVADDSDLTRRHPKEVGAGDLDYGPERGQPIAAALPWPIFLGQISRTRAKANQPYTYDFSLAGRPYAGLVGARVSAPSGHSVVQLEAETDAQKPGFVVYLADPNSQDLQPRLQIDPTGPMTIFGAMELYGDLTVDGGAVSLGPGLPPVEARPWNIYHVKKDPEEIRVELENGTKTSVKIKELEEITIEWSKTMELPKGTTNSFKVTDIKKITVGLQDGTAKILLPKNIEQIRIELLEDGKKETQFVVGAWSADQKAFVPCLTVGTDNTVKVAGNLIVGGFIDKSSDQASTASLSDAARGFQAAAMISAAGNASQQVGEIYRGSGLDPEVLIRVLDSEDGRKQVVGVITSSQPRRQAFVDALLANMEAWQDALANLIKNQAGAVAVAIAGSGAQAIVTALLANRPALETVLKGVLADANACQMAAGLVMADGDGREAAITALIAHSDQMHEFVVGLLADPAGLKETAGQLMAVGTGQQAAIAVLIAHSDQMQAFAKGLLATQDGRDAIISVLLADTVLLEAFLVAMLGFPAGCKKVAKQLVVTDEGLSVLVTALLNSPERLGSFLTKLLEDTNGRQAIVDNLLATQPGRQAAANGLTAMPEGRKTVLVGLVAGHDGQQETTNALLSATGGQDVVLGALVADADHQQATTKALLNATGGEDVVLGALVADTTGQQATTKALLAANGGQGVVLTALVADTKGQKATTKALLAANGGQDIVLSALVANDNVRQATASALLGKPAGRQAAVDVLKVNPDWGQDFIGRAIKALEGRKFLAQGMEADLSSVDALGTLIKGNFPALADRLKAALA